MSTIPARRLFTEQEQADLRRLYPTAPWPEILLAVTGRTRKQIQAWAVFKGLSRPKRGAAAKLTASPPPPKKVGRPRKEPAAARPVPKLPKRPAAPEPEVEAEATASRLPSATRKAEGPTPMGKMLAELRQLPGHHPRRLAYAEAARRGNGQDAYEAFMNWKPAADQ